MNEPPDIPCLDKEFPSRNCHTFILPQVQLLGLAQKVLVKPLISMF